MNIYNIITSDFSLCSVFVLDYKTEVIFTGYKVLTPILERLIK